MKFLNVLLIIFLVSSQAHASHKSDVLNGEADSALKSFITDMDKSKKAGCHDKMAQINALSKNLSAIEDNDMHGEHAKGEHCESCSQHDAGCESCSQHDAGCGSCSQHDAGCESCKQGCKHNLIENKALSSKDFKDLIAIARDTGVQGLDLSKHSDTSMIDLVIEDISKFTSETKE